MRNAFQDDENKSAMVDLGLGNAFPIVREVYKSLQHLRYLAENIGPMGEAITDASNKAVEAAFEAAASVMTAKGSEDNAKASAQFAASSADAARNEMGGREYTSAGADSSRNGNLLATVAIGSRALFGNASAVEFAGTTRAGDVITLTVSSTYPGIVQGTKSYSYTVKSTDTVKDIVVGLAGEMNKNLMAGPETSMQNRIEENILVLDFPGTASTGWAVTTTVSATAGSPTTWTVTTGSETQGTVAIGESAGKGPSAKSNHQGVYVGWQAAYWIRNGLRNVAIGDSAGFRLKDGRDNILIGSHAGDQISSYSNIVIGTRAGDSMTGSENIVIGDNSDGSMTSLPITGSGNIVIGRKLALPNSAGFGCLNIQGILFGKDNNATGVDVSGGKIGIGTPDPFARLDVKGAQDGTTDILRLTTKDDVAVLNVNPTGEIQFRNQKVAFGYGNGSGGSVTQVTDKSTAVTLNAPSGRIKMAGANIVANSSVTFQLNNTAIRPESVLVLNVVEQASAGCYIAQVDWLRNGFARITVFNRSNSDKAEAIELSFVVLGGSVQ